MTRDTHRLIYVAPLLEHEFDLFKVGHTTLPGIRGRRSKLRRDLSEPKLELYPIVVYPTDTLESTVRIHERQLVWMVRQRNVCLFEHATTFKYEVVYFPTTPAMRFWDESEPDKRDLSFRLFQRAFLLGDESGSSLPVPFDQVTSLLQQHRKQWLQVREVRFEYDQTKGRQDSEQLVHEQRREERERWQRVLEEERKEKARLEHLERLEAARRIKTF
jgi:hypothetical protein